jgi:hypothetical protein
LKFEKNCRKIWNNRYTHIARTFDS